LYLLYSADASHRFAGLTIDLRSMFASAFGLRSQDRCLEPLGHLSVVSAASRRCVASFAGLTIDPRWQALQASPVGPALIFA